MKLPVQQSSDSNPTIPATPATAKLSSAEMAEDRAQTQDKVSSLAPVADTSETEVQHSEKARGAIDQVAPQTAETKMEGGPIDPQQQITPKAAAVVTVPGTTYNSNDLDLDDREDSDFDDEQGSDTDQDEYFGFDDLESNAPKGEESVGKVAVHPADPHFPAPEEEIHIAEDILNYGFSDEEDHFYEDVRDYETDQEDAQTEVTPSAPDMASEAWASSEHGADDGGSTTSATEENTPMTLVATLGAAAEIENHVEKEIDSWETAVAIEDIPATSDPAMKASLAHSDHSDGKRRFLVTIASAASDDGDEVTTTPTPPGPGCGMGERSGSRTIAPIGLDHGGLEGSETNVASPSGSSQATAEGKGSVSASIAFEEDTPAPSPADEDAQRHGEDKLPKEAALAAAAANDMGRHVESTENVGNSDINQETSQESAAMANPDIDQDILLQGTKRGSSKENQGADGHVNGSQGEEDCMGDDRGEGTSGEFSKEAIHVGQTLKPLSPDLSAMEESNQDFDTVHLRIQYLVNGSKRSKASICIAVPSTITFPFFKRTILNALHHHQGFDNPRPIDIEAQISRLIVALAKKTGDATNFHGESELTAANLQRTLRRMATGSIYDVMKVQFVPGTNGEMRPRKATGIVYGRSRKVGGL